MSSQLPQLTTAEDDFTSGGDVMFYVGLHTEHRRLQNIPAPGPSSLLHVVLTSARDQGNFALMRKAKQQRSGDTASMAF